MFQAMVLFHGSTLCNLISVLRAARWWEKLSVNQRPKEKKSVKLNVALKRKIKTVTTIKYSMRNSATFSYNIMCGFCFIYWPGLANLNYFSTSFYIDNMFRLFCWFNYILIYFFLFFFRDCRRGWTVRHSNTIDVFQFHWKWYWLEIQYWTWEKSLSLITGTTMLLATW